VRSRWMCFATAGLSLWWVGLSANAATKPCPGGPSSIKAEVIRIDPPKGPAKKQTAGGREQPIEEGDFICADEGIALPVGGPVRRIELYVGGRRQVVEPRRPFKAGSGIASFLREAGALIGDLFESSGELRAPPDAPRPTAPRGSLPADPEHTMSIRALRALSGLPVQRLTHDVRPVVAWREGVGPYRCRAAWGDARASAEISVGEATSWCTIEPAPTGAQRLMVRDARGGSVSWDAEWVAWKEVPRPTWMPGGTGPTSTADRAAWALWLWRDAEDYWRLQALSMMNELASREWLAAYLRDGVLGQLARLSPP
jgi:hypothetical protein